MGYTQAPTKNTPDKASAEQAPGSADKRAALRGLDFEAGAKALAPGGASGGAPDAAAVQAAVAYNQKASWAKKPKNIRAVQGLVDAPVSGTWDTPTVDKVMGYQGQHGLDNDGKVGKQTSAAMKSELRGDTQVKSEDTAETENNEAATEVAAPGAAKSGGGTPTVADAGAASVAKPVARGAAEQSAPVSGPLNMKQIVVAQAEHRKVPFAPDWVAQMQGAIGAPVTGVLDTATVQKVAELQQSRGIKPTGVVNKATLAELRQQFPSLAENQGNERFQASGKVKKAGAGTNSDALEDKAVKEATSHPSMAAYVATFQRGTFLGDEVVGHPNFVGRLQAAEAALQVQYKGMGGKEIGEQLGSSVSNSYRPSAPGKPQAYHGIGHALDINKSKNPWVVGNPEAKKANDGTESIIDHACDFMGQGEGLKASVIAKWSKELPTEELWGKLEASNQALIMYREMAANPAAIKAQFDKRMASDKPLTGKRSKVDYWLGKVPLHDKMLRGNKSNWKGNTENLGFMDHSKALISALRDAGGLGWGGTDIGGRQSSDMMHFDNRNDGAASKLMSKIKSLRDKAKATEKGGSEGGE